MVPLTATGANKIGLSDFPCFEQELSALVRFVCEHILVIPLRN
jgi:hypothetical protein